MPSKLLCVVGPTACGKTRLGVLLAQHTGGEVVSVDSMQIYRGMTIGTAAPTQAEMAGIPHHMVAVADPTEHWSVARFTETATTCVEDILRRGKQPVLVGGTGLYLDAILRGGDFAPGQFGGAVRRDLQLRLAREGIDSLLKELRQVDPDAALRLPPADEKRILRALEVYLETGTTITAHNEASRSRPPRFDAVTIGLAFAHREDMKGLIDRRVDEMVALGLAEEVRALVQGGLSRDVTALQAIGYKEFLSVLEGNRTESEAVAEIKLRSRQYAKRQLTWLRRQKDIHWIYWEKERDFDRALQLSTEILTTQGLG